MNLQEIVVLIHNNEYGRAISLLEDEASNESRSPVERAESCRWLAECHRKLGDTVDILVAGKIKQNLLELSR